MMEGLVLPSPDDVRIPVELQKDICFPSWLTHPDPCRDQGLSAYKQIPSWQEIPISGLEVRYVPSVDDSAGIID
jgi:hypothetical protein